MNLKFSFFAIWAMFVAADLAAADFQLKSTDINDGKTIAQQFAFNNYGCTGNNVSPQLSWANFPKETKSFALAVHDPDAKTGGAGFWHWMVINIPADVNSLQQGAGDLQGKKMPEKAIQITTDFGVPGWGGPCPPEGEAPHRYKFTIYALNTESLSLPPNATASMAGFMINMHAIASAELVATYGR